MHFFHIVSKGEQMWFPIVYFDILFVLAGNPESNIALLENGGTCEASSEFTVFRTCQKAIDGLIDPGPDGSWASVDGDAIGSWLKISLPGRSQVWKIRVKNRCVLDVQMKSILLEYDDGSSQQVWYHQTYFILQITNKLELW